MKGRSNSMTSNDFVPVDLHSLCEATLIRTIVEYRQAFNMLNRVIGGSITDTREQIGEALALVEAELQQRKPLPSQPRA